MRTSTAFFAGAGTVVAAIAIGLGGGLMAGNIMSPQQPKYPSSEVSRLEQRNSQQTVQAANAASQPVAYLSNPQAAAMAADKPAQPQQPSPQPAAPSQASAQQTEPKAPETASTAQSVAAAAQPVAAVEPAAASERAAPEDSFAKARDADVKRETRRAEDKRKAERRQRLAERKKARQRHGDDLNDVEASVRDATERPLFGRSEERFDRRDARPMMVRDQGFGSGGFSLFDSD